MTAQCIFAAVIALSLPSAGEAASLTASNPPARLAVVLSQKSISAGEKLRITLELRDAFNMPTAAPKSYRLNLELWLYGKVVERQSVDLARGSSSVFVELKMDTPGIFLVKATHHELREHAAYVRVLRHTGSLRQMGTSVAGAMKRVQLSSFRQAAWIPESSWAPVTSVRRAGIVDLELRYSDMGSKLIANGADRLTVTAYLSSQLARSVDLLFHVSGGSLDPNPLRLSAGSDVGETYLTSTTPGIIQIHFVGSQPRDTVRLTTGGEKEVGFGPACKEIVLWSSPGRIPLGDSLDLGMQFLDLQGRQLERCNERNDVHLKIDQGLGYFSKNPATMQEGLSAGEVQFTPQSTGPMAISAVTFGAVSREPARIEVYFPFGTLLVVFLLSFVTTLLTSLYKQAAITRAVVGALLGGFTALLIVGFAQFGLTKVVPPQVAMNPYGAAVVAIGVGLGIVSVPVLRLKAG